MNTYTRRRFLQTVSAATLAAAGGLPDAVRAQPVVTLRCSSSMPADQNAAHYVWYERLAANLKASVGDAIRVDYFPNSQLGKESDVVQQVKIGAIDMMIAGSSIWTAPGSACSISAICSTAMRMSRKCSTARSVPA